MTMARDIPLNDAPQSDEPNPRCDYAHIIPPAEITAFQKQAAKRHFGVHGYFTKQVWSVVQRYIDQFTMPGDTVLDPFGGSGVTAIEALMLGRHAVHVDINPLSPFLVETLLMPVDLDALVSHCDAVLTRFATLRPTSADAIQHALSIYRYPQNIVLPRNSDVPTVDALFTQKQLAELALLKHLILTVKEPRVQQHLLLMFSGLLNKINRTYHASAGRSAGRGDSSMFRYYRYRIAQESPPLEITDVFRSRLRHVLAAKLELLPVTARDTGTLVKDVRQGSATHLSWIKTESIDYIYTDPPYGAKIPYLDLSTMWNAWLDFPVTPHDRAMEVIEGGDDRKTKADYSDLLAASIEEMYRVLKFDRWLSLAFSHSDPAYWQLIVDTADRAGFEYVSVTRQNNGQASFKKRQNPFSVLSGQLILNFRKTRGVRSRRPSLPPTDVANAVMATIRTIIQQHDGATIEQINDALVIRGLETGMLGTLSQAYSDLTPVLRKHFVCQDDGRWYLQSMTRG